MSIVMHNLFCTMSTNIHLHSRIRNTGWAGDDASSTATVPSSFFRCFDRRTSTQHSNAAIVVVIVVSPYWTPHSTNTPSYANTASLRAVCFIMLCLYILRPILHSVRNEGDDSCIHHQNSHNWNNFRCEPFHDH